MDITMVINQIFRILETISSYELPNVHLYFGLLCLLIAALLIWAAISFASLFISKGKLTWK